MIYLGIIEDEPLMLQSIKESFALIPNVKVTLEAESMEECQEELTDDLPLNMLFLDINLPGLSGLHGIHFLKERRPDLDIIMLTNKDDSDHIFKALCAGAVSYISKKKASPRVLQDALFTVSRGGSYMSPGIARKVIGHFARPNGARKAKLTPRQMQIVELLVDGLSYKMIADELKIGVETVRDHIKKIYKSLEVNSKAQVIRKRMDGEI
ncbi:MAG: DNA-binding response regulator [Bacteroidetes bacterium]|nr:MAG: DNA-binding response regulator [Bacteroidota bacterium]